MKDFLKRISSRKFICAILIALIVFANEYWNWEMNPQEVLIAISGLLAFLGIEGLTDYKSRVTG